MEQFTNFNNLAKPPKQSGKQYEYGGKHYQWDDPSGIFLMLEQEEGLLEGYESWVLGLMVKSTIEIGQPMAWTLHNACPIIQMGAALNPLLEDVDFVGKLKAWLLTLKGMVLARKHEMLSNDNSDTYEVADDKGIKVVLTHRFKRDIAVSENIDKAMEWLEVVCRNGINRAGISINFVDAYPTSPRYAAKTKALTERASNE